MQEPLKILLFGYGNPGRQDDGLGNEFIDQIEDWIEAEKLDNIEVDSNYQLNIEDADTISKKDVVIFVDASIEQIEDFILTRVTPDGARIEFTMHAVSASFVLDLCNKIYKKFPDTYMLHIKGYEWEFEEGLTVKAKQNLDKALKFTKNLLENPNDISKSVNKQY